MWFGFVGGRGEVGLNGWAAKAGVRVKRWVREWGGGGNGGGGVATPRMTQPAPVTEARVCRFQILEMRKTKNKKRGKKRPIPRYSCGILLCLEEWHTFSTIP